MPAPAPGTPPKRQHARAPIASQQPRQPATPLSCRPQSAQKLPLTGRTIDRRRHSEHPWHPRRTMDVVRIAGSLILAATRVSSGRYSTLTDELQRSAPSCGAEPKGKVRPKWPPTSTPLKGDGSRAPLLPRCAPPLACRPPRAPAPWPRSRRSSHWARQSTGASITAARRCTWPRERATVRARRHARAPGAVEIGQPACLTTSPCMGPAAGALSIASARAPITHTAEARRAEPPRAAEVGQPACLTTSPRAEPPRGPSASRRLAPAPL